MSEAAANVFVAGFAPRQDEAVRLQRVFSERPAGFAPGDLIARIEEAFSASPQPNSSPEPAPVAEPPSFDPVAAAMVEAPPVDPLAEAYQAGFDAGVAAARAEQEAAAARDPALIEGIALHMQATNTVRTRINSRKISLTDTLRRSLSEFPAPLAGIWGTHDATATGEFLDAREALIRSFDAAAEFVRIDAGHWVPFEASDLFNETVLAILASPRQARAAGTTA